MRAYPVLLRVGLSQVMAYRAEFIIWILTTNMPLVMLAIWHAVAADGPVGRFDQSDFTAYYFSALIVRLATSTWIVWQLSMEIRNGTLAARLLRPMHPLLAVSAEQVAALPLRILMSVPMMGVLVYATGMPAALLDWRLMAVLLLSLVGAWFLVFFFMVLLSATAFYLESAIGLFELWLGAHFILSGYLIPLELLPSWVAPVARALPFRYTLGFPVETLLGLIGPRQALFELVVQWTYVALLASTALWLWNRGVRRYVAFGG